MKALNSCVAQIAGCQGRLAEAEEDDDDGGDGGGWLDWVKWVRSEASGHASDTGV